MPAPKWSVGMRRIGPGIYVSDATRALHFDADELCLALGVPPTPENVKRAEAIAAQVVREHFGNVNITHVED